MDDRHTQTLRSALEAAFLVRRYGSQGSLAEAAGVDQSAVSAVLNGRRAAFHALNLRPLLTKLEADWADSLIPTVKRLLGSVVVAGGNPDIGAVVGMMVPR